MIREPFLKMICSATVAMPKESGERLRSGWSTPYSNSTPSSAIAARVKRTDSQGSNPRS